MHKYNDLYFFEYTEDELKNGYFIWQLNTCKMNPGKLMRIYEDKDFLSDIDGQVIAVKYYQKNWRGKVKINNRNEEVNLTDDWIEGNFYDEFIQQWKRKLGIWNMVLVGCPKSHETKPSIHPSNLQVKYPQGNLQACMLASFASCLHYKGMIRESGMIMRCAGYFELSTQFYDNFCNIVVEACKPKYKIIRNKRFQFNQEEYLFDSPTMVVLIGKDGSCDHAITVYKDMVFDASHGKILLRNAQTLDWCCPPLGFQQVHRAYSLAEVKSSMKKQKNHN